MSDRDVRIPEAIASASAHAKRRLVERLRDGVLDPLVVQTLTMGRERITRAFESAAQEPAHLFLRGAYGMGKSHAVEVIAQLARSENYATSVVQLDPRELPFHHLEKVYRASMRGMELPGGEDLVRRFRAFAAEQEDVASVLPSTMPGRFFYTLVALASKTMKLSERRRRARRHRFYKPRAFSQWLRRAWEGDPVSAHRLRHVMRYREVGSGRTPLTVRDKAEWQAQFAAVAELLKTMGYAGWVVLFDEAESIAQLRSNHRPLSYEALAWWCGGSSEGLIPVFAATKDLFEVMEADGVEVEDLRCVEVGVLDESDWALLEGVLLVLHQQVYDWSGGEEVREALDARQALTRGFETRLRLKALVDELDLLAHGASRS